MPAGWGDDKPGPEGPQSRTCFPVSAGADHLGMADDLDIIELRRLRLAQAELCVLEEWRQASLIMAERYAVGAQVIEGRIAFAAQSSDRTEFG
jgi:hypothetical protein